MRFEKWQGCGNDFIVVHSSELDAPLTPERVRSLCDRRRGIGADGVLVIHAPTGGRWPVEIHNADGSVAESCGNGSRCVAKHIMDRRGLDECELDTLGGLVRARREGDGVAVDLAAPRVIGEATVGATRATRVDVGNPHVVVFVEDPAAADLGTIARAWRAAEGDANVGVARVRSRSEMDLRVDERGVGETLACGTGACAAVAAAASRGLVGDVVSVRLPGGTLIVRSGNGRYELAGPSERVFSGSLDPAP
jgi:diaminopimelate epimerase